MAGHTGLGRIVPDEKHGEGQVGQHHEGIVTPLKTPSTLKLDGDEAESKGGMLVGVIVGAVLVVMVVVGIYMLATGRLSV